MAKLNELRKVLKSVDYEDGPQKCSSCTGTYTLLDVTHMMIDMYGADPAYWDEDYLVQVYGLCPDCWL